tara:strand:+ start:190 stop:492 length:303 start_codon:yes stop_codon:yes gene_type:complete
MIEIKFKKDELEYMKLLLENVIDNFNGTEKEEDGNNVDMIEDLYSKLVCIKFNTLMGIKRDKYEKAQNELEWYRMYGDFINENYPNVDGEACSYADGDNE